MILGGESLDRRADATPTPVVAENLSAGREQSVVVEQILIDVLFLVAAIQIDQLRPQIGPHQPQRGGRRRQRKWDDALLMSAVADVGEEAVID